MKELFEGKAAESQMDTLTMRLELKLIKSLINSNIATIKSSKINDKPASINERYLNFQILLGDNLVDVSVFNDKDATPKRCDTLSWCFSQICSALLQARTSHLGDMLPSKEMTRFMLLENLNLKPSESAAFMNLFNLNPINASDL